MKYSNTHCFRDYWLDYPRKEMVEIDKQGLTHAEKQKLFRGETV